MPAPGIQSRKNESTRTRILEAALDILRRDGPSKASMEDIARRAGLSRQALYLHFSSKDELTYQAARHTFEARHAEVQAVLASKRPLIERLVSALTAMHSATRSDGASRAARFWKGYDAPVIDRVIEIEERLERSFIELLGHTLAAEGKDSQPEPHDASASEVASLLNATAHGLAMSSRAISSKAYARLLRLAVTRLCVTAR